MKQGLGYIWTLSKLSELNQKQSKVLFDQSKTAMNAMSQSELKGNLQRVSCAGKRAQAK